jgi:hypothetical protein
MQAVELCRLLAEREGVYSAVPSSRLRSAASSPSIQVGGRQPGQQGLTCTAAAQAQCRREAPTSLVLPGWCWRQEQRRVAHRPGRGRPHDCGFMQVLLATKSFSPDRLPEEAAIETVSPTCRLPYGKACNRSH